MNENPRALSQEQLPTGGRLGTLLFVPKFYLKNHAADVAS
jgi:hypothetical protein